MKTQTTKQKQIERKWHLVDAKDQVLGRIAGRIAYLLRGKGKAYFVPHLDCGDHVVVVNAKEVLTTGKKEKQKIYTRYSGYPGGLKKETLGELRKRKPEEIIRRAVLGMLPKNKLKDRWMAKLHIFADHKHKHEDKFKEK